MSLNLNNIEKLYQAYLRKIPDKKGIIIDKESGEILYIKK